MLCTEIVFLKNLHTTAYLKQRNVAFGELLKTNFAVVRLRLLQLKCIQISDRNFQFAFNRY